EVHGWRSRYLDRRQLIEFCLLAGQYDALAALGGTVDFSKLIMCPARPWKHSCRASDIVG
ncbi:MAG TPA: hypothetical protein VMD51_11900, partial [Mycobacterium sp.]|nr:hypothetical protein [Mycobacterium sp.]